MTVKELFLHLRVEQVIYFETYDGHYIEHGPAGKLWQKYQDCIVGLISCNNPYKSMFVGIRNPDGKKFFREPGENELW